MPLHLHPEFSQSKIHMVMWLILPQAAFNLLLSIYATRQTCRPIIPAPFNVFFAGQDSRQFQRDLQEIPEEAFDLVAEIKFLLPNWPEQATVSFPKAWWAENVPNDKLSLTSLTDDTIAEASAFFLGMWDTTDLSPMDKARDKRLAIVRGTVGILLAINCHDMNAVNQSMETSLEALHALSGLRRRWQ
ncbi:hypothetical protein EV363DRAFT_1403206 [Boletus edulis]|nr:hypothetical protein EV363DRAFT_1403206 [Boletus edulis]